MENYVELMMELRKPMYHTPTMLGINKFKKELDTMFPNLNKSRRSRLIKAYKKRAWMEWTSVARYRGTFPTHPNYGKKVKITTSGLQAEYEVEVNGKR